MTAAERVRDAWVQRGTSVVAPSDHRTIQEKLSIARLEVATDFVEFLAVAGGMTDGTMDPDLWSVWDVNHIVTENQRMKKEEGAGVYFADWLIHSHHHLVRRETPDVSSVWVEGFATPGIEKVADSLEGFLERYLARDESVGVYFEADEEKTG